ncbi:MAG TPA: hypothetical protein VK574_10725 [Terracidiphilus sp.]|nr:hypothetical protein [Terracidiphilus sp.]
MQDSHRPAKDTLHWILICGACCAGPLLWSQAPKSRPTPPSETQPAPPSTPADSNPSYGPTQSGPIAIVPLDSKDPASAAMVTGALQVANGRAMIATNGAITSGTGTTEVTLPRRGVLRVCASTTVKLAADASVPKDEIAGLMMVIDHGAVEASFATGRNSDVLLTPDFRILIGGPGAADVKVRLGQHGDTCVDNAGVSAPYVLVTSVFDGGIYRVQAGQRVMFQHGSVTSVVDQEKESCGCPAPLHPNTNEFPEAQSAGLSPLPPPGPPGVTPSTAPTEATDTFVHKSGEPPPATDTITATGGEPVPPVHVPRHKLPKVKGDKKPGFMARMGHFFRRLFGAE